MGSLPFYQAVQNEIEVFEHAYQKKLPLLLKGPTGCGKSRFVEHMAAKLAKPLITITCHEETSSVDLVGRYILKGTDTVWMDGPLTTALKSGSILYLDEIVEARPDTLVCIHSITDYRRQLFIDRLNLHLQAHNDFMLVASFNPGYQKGWKELKPSTRQRFIALHFDYPKSDLESQIIHTETNLNLKQCQRLVQLATKIRNLDDLGLLEKPSTRLLVDAAHLMGTGLAARLSCDVAIIQPLSDDPPTLNALKDLVALYF